MPSSQTLLVLTNRLSELVLLLFDWSFERLSLAATVRHKESPVDPHGDEEVQNDDFDGEEEDVAGRPRIIPCRVIGRSWRFPVRASLEARVENAERGRDEDDQTLSLHLPRAESLGVRCWLYGICQAEDPEGDDREDAEICQASELHVSAG